LIALLSVLFLCDATALLSLEKHVLCAQRPSQWISSWEL